MKKLTAAAIVLLLLFITADIYGWKNPDKVVTLRASISRFFHYPGRYIHFFPAGPAAKDGPPMPFDNEISTASILNMRQLLASGSFDKLDALLTGYEKTFGAKDGLIDVYSAFEVNGPGLEGELNEWVSKSPDDYRPLLARASYLVNMGYKSRGTKEADRTTTEQFSKMTAYFTLAGQDLDKVLKMEKGIVVPYFMLIRMSAASEDIGRRQAREFLKEGLAVSPASFRLRSIYLTTITPRWGGSYQEMDAVATAARKYLAVNPELAVLTGYAFYDAGDMQLIDKNYNTALALLNKAMTYGEWPLFLKDRARAYVNMKMPKPALRDIDLAIQLDPNDPDAYYTRAPILVDCSRLKEGLRDIETAIELDPGNKYYLDEEKWMAKNLVYQGFRLQKQKNLAAAMADYDLAVQADPNNAYVYYWRAMGYLAQKDQEHAMDDLDKAIELNPDYFNAYLVRDRDILSERKDWDGIISQWNKYIALNPRDGRAYLERGGAYYHKGELALALKDAKHSADLGDAQGKMIYERLKGR